MAEQLMSFVSGVQYTGSNGAALVSEIPAQVRADYSIKLVSEAGGVLTLSYECPGLTTIMAGTGDWVVWFNSPPSVITDTQLNLTYVKRSDLA